MKETRQVIMTEMSNEEAIEVMEKGEPFSELFDEKWETAKKMAIAALKKEIPKPISIENGFVKCGGCGMYIRFPIADHYNNCPECGQKILWKGDTE